VSKHREQRFIRFFGTFVWFFSKLLRILIGFFRFFSMKITFLLFLIAMSFASAHADDKRIMILEYKDVGNFKVSATPAQRPTELEISGLAFHSALAVEKMENERRGEILYVRLVLVPARKGISGRFSYKIPIPDGVTKVVFGNNQHKVWP
jgi:hypothetical protein